ncbi:MAG: 50S ribosomal protein L30 [Oscillospiraceae bacterium]|nr:50S ribosomal protein L30 [Oscillospiraceae bacterium]
MAKKTVKITLVKSLIGSSKTQLATAAALGLKRPGDVAEQPDNAQTGGQIFKLSHLVRVEK